jgi:hypothetical protein
MGFGYGFSWAKNYDGDAKIDIGYSRNNASGRPE